MSPVESVPWLAILRFVVWLVQKMAKYVPYLRRRLEMSQRWNRLLDRVTGFDERTHPEFHGKPAAEVFVDLVGARDSRSVYSAFEKRHHMEWADRLGGLYKGWPLHLAWRWQAANEYCIATFLDGSRLTCHIGGNSEQTPVSDPAQVLRPVRLESADPERALAVREYLDRNEVKRACAETLDERPGLHINAGTGEVTSVPAPDRVSVEGGEYKVGKSSVWDPLADLNAKLRRLQGTYRRH